MHSNMLDTRSTSGWLEHSGRHPPRAHAVHRLQGAAARLSGRPQHPATLSAGPSSSVPSITARAHVLTGCGQESRAIWHHRSLSARLGTQGRTHHVQARAATGFPTLLPVQGPWGVWTALIIAGTFGLWCVLAWALRLRRRPSVQARAACIVSSQEYSELQPLGTQRV